MLLSSYLTIDDIKKLKIYIQISSKAIEQGKKEGKTEIQKFQYLKNKKSFLNEIKL